MCEKSYFRVLQVISSVLCLFWVENSICDWEPLQGAHPQIATAVIYKNSVVKLLEPFEASCFFVGLSRANVILATS